MSRRGLGVGWLGLGVSGCLHLSLQHEPVVAFERICAARDTHGAEVVHLDPEDRSDLVELGRSVLGRAVLGDVEGALAHRDAFRRLGLDLVVTTIDGELALALVDGDGPRGVYVIRLGPVDAEVVLQAPHRYFDLHTGTLATRMFAAARVRALFMNTQHRYGATGGVPADDSPSDVAHHDAAPFTALTEAAGHELEGAVILQLHGFGAEDALAGTEAIVSAGPTPHAAWRDRVVAVLVRLGVAVKRFPEDVAVLGGTTNAQGRTLAKTRTGFVHLETDLALRTRLLQSDAALLMQELVVVLGTRTGAPR